MATILVLTGRDDLTADAVVEELVKRGEHVVRFDTADFPTASRLAVSLTGDGWAGSLAGSRTVRLETVKSVWWRRPNEFRTPDEWPGPARALAVSEARSGLLGVLGSLPVRWVNHPGKDAAANYKPVQLAVAARCGLDVPRSVITSDAGHARTFMGDDTVVYKGLGGGVLGPGGERRFLPVALVSADQVDDGVCGTAHLFQERVAKAYEVRLTVIGGRMFAVAIHTDSEAAQLDWRTDYRSHRYEVVDVPPSVAKGIRRLMDTLGLFFGALDFAVTPDGRWVFFEVNPNGQWHWLAVKAGVPLVEAMAAALQGDPA
ncbi:ATP-grasp ribosomal peptide maturase [Streptomyces chrestomyceticus JCM 4735]|uniref:ATP-grasp ribosomal peptide maturase n=1 Tax=Streptomyces chrestomyceticus JCM 4735 TaxID=1306181 RepID=A0A7U9Q172_9ACTN|nr:ATP-grasp ribosomal peptide maturase [Streptomyces chrestomyceticus]GCD38555.1 ATP-grasp ribosomal peptide maturase [Streptomyces chrestomyceticus JCM 4735]